MYFMTKKQILSKKQKVLVDILNPQKRFSRNEFLRKVKELNPVLEKKGSSMSHQTFQNELDDLVKRKIVIKEPQRVGKQKRVYYSLPEVSEAETRIVSSFEKSFDDSKTLIELLKNKKFHHFGNKNKNMMQVDEQNFVAEALSYLMVQKILLEHVYHMFAEYSIHSKILQEGEEIFNDIQLEFKELQAKYGISNYRLLGSLTDKVGNESFQVTDLYDPIIQSYDMEFDD